MPWWEKLLMAPFALLAYILFGLGAAVIAAVGALVFGVLNRLLKYYPYGRTCSAAASAFVAAVSVF